MFDAGQMILIIGLLLGLVFLGVHIAVALGVTAGVGLYIMMQGNFDVIFEFLSTTAYVAIRGYIFAVIPLFMLMGEFLARSGVAGDLFRLVNRLTRWLPGHLGVATVIANAIFAFVTGVSVAAAAAFSRIAYPQMKRYGYERMLSLSCVAGSSCLGMLIPPSVLLIVWAVLTEQSIGRLFLAGIIPGLLLTVAYMGYIIFTAIRSPERVGKLRKDADAVAVEAAAEREREDDADMAGALVGTLAVVALVLGILFGIWLGFFTPTEGAGVGAAAGLVIALLRGMKPREIFEVILSVGRTSAPLLLLLVMAQLYARVLSLTGVTGGIETLLVNSPLTPLMILGVMILIWLVLGCLIDSISIILLTVPIFAPVAVAIGIDPLAFAIMGIIAIEAGLLTPPFGILVYTVKAALPEENIPVFEIFRGTIPFWFLMIGLVVVIIAFPQVATWLPSLS
ncbi:TRAP transporter large permease [Pelagibacterium montanilacus]|uniref:TRAP transporter large permease n=1 Tax=Pelagibacterium montanilacus TaxID=2185280 RepID=UPI000F8E75CB|nr:TRAP transporter large permease [Pelagibacterium montanilacus]